MTAPFTPQRRSAIEKRALEAGAILVEQDGWRQVNSFTSPEAEVRTVREGAGMCDLSPLTKLDLRARDPLDAWSKIFPGVEAPAGNRICSATLCGQPILAARLNPETIFLTGPPGWGQAMEAAVREAVSGAKVSVTDVTSGFSVIELTGAAIPSILRKLTPVEPLAENRTMTQARVAHVRSIIFRVNGLSREDGSSVPVYRLHVLRDVGLFVWDALEDAGREFKLSPYGMEARSRLFSDSVSG